MNCSPGLSRLCINKINKIIQIYHKMFLHETFYLLVNNEHNTFTLFYNLTEYCIISKK